MSVWRVARWVLGAVVVAVAVSACHPGGVHLFVVNTTVDGADANPGDEICEMTVGVGDCSLRAAIDEVNAHAAVGPGVSIVLEPGLGTVTLTSGGSGEDANATGDLDITQTGVQILGNGNTIDASEIAGGDRVFDVHTGAQVTFLGHEVTSVDPLTPSGADVVTTITGGDAANGGNIRNRGVLTLEWVAIEGGAANNGGGVRSYGPSLVVRNSTITGNGAYDGSGIMSHKALVVEDSVIDANTDGDGIHLEGHGFPVAGGFGTKRITRSTISNHRQGIENRADGLLLEDSTVTGNDIGGGIYNLGELTVVGSTISDNRKLTSNGTIGGGINTTTSGSLTIVDSTIEGNRSHTGGGIYSRGPTTIVGSTIADNEATSSSEGRPPAGAGIYFRSWASLSMERSTVSGNVGASAIHASDGAVRLSFVTVRDNAVAPAIQVDDALAVEGSIISQAGVACVGPVTSLGHNVSSDATCGLTATGDTPAVPILLGPLADNGGLTATHLPPAGAVDVLDAIPDGTAGLCDGSFPTDQRGTARPAAGAACDRGAVERQTEDP